MSGADRHLSQTFSGDEVAHALVRAASALMPTLSPDKLSVAHQGVETSLRTPDVVEPGVISFSTFT